MSEATPVPVSDPELVAYLDGELGLVDAGRVAAALHQDPELRARARAMREAAELLRVALGPVVAEPVPPRLLGAVLPPARTDFGPPRRVPALGQRLTGLARSAMVRRAAAIVLLLGAGTASGWFGARMSAPGQNLAFDPVMARTEIQLVQNTLETQRSGTVSTWRDPRGNATLAVAPVRTFKDGDERFCREFRETVTRDGKRALLRFGVACRDADGQWNAQYYLVPAREPAEPMLDG
jgi:surface antigen